MAIMLFFTIGYLIGSIPFGYLIAKIKKFDIRQFSSGNIGATNIFRKFGLTTGLLVGFLDFFKSYFFVVICFSSINFSTPIKLILSISPIIGHIFPVWLKFKGGKGVSCTYGLIAAIFGWKFILFWVIIWLALLLTTHLMSLTNLIISLIFPIIFTTHFHSPFFGLFGLFLTLTIWWTHRSNIQKLIKHQENKIYFLKTNKI